MKINFENKLDGLGRPARPIQLKVLQKLRETWNDYQVHVLDLKPGSGKSFIAKTIERTVGDTAIVTPSNMLIDQYVRVYPDMVFLKGSEHYDTREDYEKARAQALFGGSAVFNPLSFYYGYLNSDGAVKPSTVVIDEAHKLADMLLLTLCKHLKCEYYGIPDNLDSIKFLVWLEARLGRLQQVIERGSRTKTASRLQKQYDQLGFIYHYLKDHLDTVETCYSMVSDRKSQRKCQHISIKPLKFPSGLTQTVFGEDTRFVLMSGSITSFHIEELFGIGSKYQLQVYDHPAPIENRMIHFDPIPQTKRKNLSAIVDKIKKVWEEKGKPNTLVHIPYSEQYVYLGLMEGYPAIFHGKDTKDKALKRFKQEGGILFASGMAEGIDLPGKLCELIIIPKLLYPNRGAEAVQKKLAFPNGDLWYTMDTIMTTIQQMGRGMRGKDDFCETVIFDYTFGNLIKQAKKYLSQDFLRSIKWY